MDNIVIHEVIYSLKTTGTLGMLIKLEFSKAFDKHSWQYIQAIMQAFGFCEEWTCRTINLISLAFFSILLNGSPMDTFAPSRGIHQGDPLSPFIFILMTEGLSRFIKVDVRTSSLTGLSIHSMHPPPTHS